MKQRPVLQLLLFAAIVIAIQVIASMANKSYYLTQMTMAVYYSMVVLGLSLLMGYAGQVSLGHGAFFAMGGYISAFLTTHDFSAASSAPWAQSAQTLGLLVTRPGLYETTPLLSVAPWVAFLAGMLATFVVALIIGYPSLRLKGHYLAMATLGFGLIVYRILLGTSALGSADGITGVPPWSMGFGLSITGKSIARVQNYYFAWAIAFLVLILLTNLVRSRVGRAMRAIHDGELAASVTGINTSRLKLQAFVASALIAAAAGSFMAHYNQGVGPSEASALKSVRYVALVAAGGMANLSGSLIVSTLLTFLSLRGWFGTYDNAVFGLLLILIVALAPQGPLKPLEQWLRWLGRPRRPAQEDPRAAA